MARARRQTERDEVERPFIDQLVSMGWTHVHGPDLAAERSYDDVFLTGRMDAALRRINRLAKTGSPWVKGAQATRAIDNLRRAAKNIAGRPLLTANRETTELLLHGTHVKGDEAHHHGTDQKAHYIDWDIESPNLLERNDFLVVDQLQVNTADKKPEILDLVLFVNGIPLAVVECKSPDIKDPIVKAVEDLRAYSGNPLTDDGRKDTDAPRAVPELFAPAQLLIAACGETAALGTISADEAHYAPWRSVTPHYRDDRALRRELEEARTADGRRVLEPGAELTEQHKLIAIVLRPENLLNIVRHYVFELPLKVKDGEPAKTVKAVCRHQQYRAVEKIVHELRTGRTPLDAGAEDDERGGVIWHTQGSGKSLTMAFLARRLHESRAPELNRFTLLVVTDRTQLQDQLSAAVRVSGSTIGVATSQADLEGRLERAGPYGSSRVGCGWTRPPRPIPRWLGRHWRTGTRGTGCAGRGGGSSRGRHAWTCRNRGSRYGTWAPLGHPPDGPDRAPLGHLPAPVPSGRLRHRPRAGTRPGLGPRPGLLAAAAPGDARVCPVEG